MSSQFQKRKGIMLAYPAEEKRIKAFPVTGDGTRNFFHQPKLNGERGKVEWFGKAPYLISSHGNEFKFIPHIRADLVRLAEVVGQLSFDGEVYVHGWSREEVDSALRRKVNKSSESVNLEYHIFDLQSEAPQWERIRQLGIIAQEIERLQLTSIKVVDYGVCNENNWLTHCSTYCEEGYEGIILRNPFGLYVEKRSADLLKFKPTETDLYRIIDVNEAVSLDGTPKGMVGSFEVAATDEPGDLTSFNVGAGKLPHHERVRYWLERERIKGLFLLVKHELLTTTNKVPIAAVSVAVME